MLFYLKTNIGNFQRNILKTSLKTGKEYLKPSAKTEGITIIDLLKPKAKAKEPLAGFNFWRIGVF